MVSLLKELADEKVVPLNPRQEHGLPFVINGIVKLVDKKGKLRGMVLDREAWEDVVEFMESSNPKFWEKIEKSRRSGRVSSKDIEARLGIK